jgi:hypothetical protein
MDIFGGLSAVGSSITEKVCKPRAKSAPKKSPIKSSVNGNIYNSNVLPQSRAQYQAMADARHARSKCPTKTGVISNYYNLEKNKDKDCDSTFSDNVSQMSSHSDVGTTDPYRLGDDIRNNTKHIEKFMNGTDSFVNQFAPMTYDNPSSPSAANKVSRVSLNPTRLSLERDLCTQGGFSKCDDDMTYGVIPVDKQTHNNMVPFFKSREGHGTSIDDHKHLYDNNQRKLDLFTGSLNNLQYKPKTERKPLFNPLVGLTNIYGMPSMTDAMEGRGHVSHERRNEKPFQEVKVTPGLNLGYNEVGKSGYHDPVRFMDKSIDELRVQNKKQISYTLPMIQGQKGSMQPLIPTVPKRKPETFQEWGTKRMLPTSSVVEAHQIENFDAKNMATVNRGTKERMTYGPAKLGATLPTPESLIAKVKVSSNENYEYDGPHAIGLVNGQQNRCPTESWNAPMTQRMMPNTYVAPVASSNSRKTYAFSTLDNVPDPNMRNIHPEYDRAGFVGNSQYSKTYAYDPANATPDPNMRNIHNEYDRAGFVGNSQFNREYVYDYQNATPDPNMRNIHSEYDRAGFVGNSQYNKTYAYDAVNATPDPTMRDVHNEYDRAGFVGNSQYNKQYAFNYADATPDPNMRNVHSEYDRAGFVGNSQYNKQYAFNYADATPDPTMRDIHGDADRAGFVGNSQYNKKYAFDYANAVPDPTMRDIHGDADRAGFIGNSQYNKRFAFDYANAVPDPTQREIYCENEYQGPVSYHERQRLREDAQNMYQNTINEQVAVGRAPTVCNVSKGPTMDGTMVQLCDNVRVNRDLYPDLHQLVTPKVPTLYTRPGHSLPNDEYRFNEHPIVNLKTNPYINNTQHRSNIKIQLDNIPDAYPE